MPDGGTQNRGGSGDVMPLQRLDDVEQQLQGLAAEFTRLSAENVTANTKLKLLEENDHRHEENIKQIKESTIEMKVQFNAIMGKFDQLENRIFMLLQQSGKDNQTERKFWMDLLKYVIGGTIFVIVGYIFIGGK
ncbi:putative nuclease with TOPRIM domain [Paenibacillus sp. PastF-1]|nr:putative nuclease with TOPRIM domain [Paenibacillus sp. PastF-2]MDF9852060.1 putative nuclease with TOPRIM domain [Paenibacillus sp. PastM-2]MDF9858635.1 putative nuclease with TOPRIM domain [Paenibacillus sp. PastF-1]MDH6483901.1 putative nuclease with TOPRIM domain [Paenibacillus sp. PastH-2]MDH6511270.1 putative nuclease with TOPRIM domain [Paenibacillus sp. PastM-3]